MNMLLLRVYVHQTSQLNLILVLELGNQLVNHHNLHVTVFVITTAEMTVEKISHFLDSSPNDHLDGMLLPSGDISDIVDPYINMVTKIVVTMHESLLALYLQFLE
ncbi:hypothetical protein Ddye_013739 [Dipteronia dyeriana]|uniref:Uncharacterized protein n=1 Tax=Dipteronia dyeriana TaxID=168575 RepID=A0AAD9X6Z2_9ROSI|nr:hypothetical protein Ddye_013739 [Dipteronia dyeriana]